MNDLIEDYLKRIKKYHNIEIIEVKDSNIEEEGNRLLKYINDKDYVITLDIKGEMIDSKELACKVNDIFVHYPVITFVIGGSLGIDERVKEKSNYSLSFSKLTYPHGLFRGILLEQIYRCFKINNNESYHK